LKAQKENIPLFKLPLQRDHRDWILHLKKSPLGDLGANFSGFFLTHLAKVDIEHV
jgi:hypothetical protein